MKTTTTPARTRKVTVMSLTAGSAPRPVPAYVWTGEPGPRRIPSRYHATKKSVQVM
jgi:hypothetical protein